MRNKIGLVGTALASAAAMLITLTAPCITSADTLQTTYEISSADDLIRLSEKCSLDTFSQGKTFVLTKDINLLSTNFEPIPTFGGSFDGGGFTIKGLVVKDSTQSVGLFRYIQKDGVVRSLNVEATIIPGGTHTTAGGIVGTNDGLVASCSFSGAVEGDSNIGGIAGINRETGRISRCTSDASLVGQSFTGGIAGQNQGVIVHSDSKSKVNIVAKENTVSLDSIDLSLDIGSTIEQLTSPAAEEKASDSSVSGHTDSGGIAGYSSGIIEYCCNFGTVGYQHVGYNIGGVVGRQAGYIAHCTNTGEVYGRKDVGGIVGQAEPDIITEISKDTLDELDTELDALSEMINKAINDAAGSSTDISNQLTAVSDNTTLVKNSAHSLTDMTTAFVDENVEEINNISTMISDYSAQTLPFVIDMKDAAAKITAASDKIGEALGLTSSASETGTAALDRAKTASDKIKEASVHLSDALDNLETAINSLEGSVTVYDSEAVESAFTDIGSSMDDFGTALSELSQGFSELQNELDSIDTSSTPDYGDITDGSDIKNILDDIDWKRFSPSLTLFEHALIRMSAAATTMGTAVDTISQNVSFNEEEAKNGAEQLKIALEGLRDSADGMSGVIDDLSDILDKVKSISSQSTEIIGGLQQAADSFSEAFDSITKGITQVKEVLNRFISEKPAKFRKLGEEYTNETSDLFTYLTATADSLADLNSLTADVSVTLSADFNRINDQFNKVMKLVVDTASDLTDSSNLDVSQYIEDTSEQNLSSTKMGKVYSCVNSGAVSGDKNIGGIAGTMAIDYDLDPEDDLTDNISHNTTFETKAILQECVNRGLISSKKDCSGGINGRMEVGTIYRCENYGAVESVSGDYVGGISGLSKSGLLNDFAKCTISGRDYVGGIAGSAVKLKDCCGAVTVLSSREFCGAIAGQAEVSDGDVARNSFLETGTAGIDGISYEKIAEPKAYAAIKAMSGVPADFLRFNLTFVADDNVTAVLHFDYGEDLSKLNLPEVPEKDDCYGKWEVFDTSGTASDIIVNAVYTPCITVLSSVEKGKDGLAEAMINGTFDENAVLHITKSSGIQTNDFNAAGIIKVSVENSSLDEQSVSKIRLLNEYDTDNIVVYRLSDNSYVPAEFTLNGSYVVLSMNGTEGSYCIVAKDFTTLRIVLAAAGGGIVAAVIIIFIAVKAAKRRKAKKHDLRQ